MGIAYTMIPVSSWQNPGGGSGYDTVGYYPDPPTIFHGEHQQATSITVQSLPMAAYMAYGNYGLTFHITKKSKFWAYFQVDTCWHKDTIIGSPGDGGLPAASKECRGAMMLTCKDWEWFNDQKNQILARFDTVYKSGHDYNQFDANGVSPADLAGVFHYTQYTTTKQPPSEADMCNFFKKVNPARTTPWPVYNYTWHEHGELTIERYLNCGSVSANASAVADPEASAEGIVV